MSHPSRARRRGAYNTPRHCHSCETCRLGRWLQWGGGAGDGRRAVVCIPQWSSRPNPRSSRLTAVDWTFGIAIWPSDSFYVDRPPHLLVVIHTIRENSADRIISHNVIILHASLHLTTIGTKQPDRAPTTHMSPRSRDAPSRRSLHPPRSHDHRRCKCTGLSCPAHPSRCCRRQRTRAAPLTHPPHSKLDPQSSLSSTPMAPPGTRPRPSAPRRTRRSPHTARCRQIHHHSTRAARTTSAQPTLPLSHTSPRRYL